MIRTACNARVVNVPQLVDDAKANAVVVLLTPDDEARLCEELRGKQEPDHEKALMGQARPNVLFEAGMAFGTHPDRTIVVELGALRPFSDIHGRHTIRLDGSSTADGAGRKELLRAAADAVTNALKAFDRRKGATEENVAERGEAFDARVLDVALLVNDDTRLSLGPARNAELLEIVTIVRDDNTELAIHAMKMRDKYQELLPGG